MPCVWQCPAREEGAGRKGKSEARRGVATYYELARRCVARIAYWLACCQRSSCRSMYRRIVYPTPVHSWRAHSTFWLGDFKIWSFEELHDDKHATVLTQQHLHHHVAPDRHHPRRRWRSQPGQPPAPQCLQGPHPPGHCAVRPPPPQTDSDEHEH
jgi:hypothetical protein